MVSSRLGNFSINVIKHHATLVKFALATERRDAGNIRAPTQNNIYIYILGTDVLIIPRWHLCQRCVIACKCKHLAAIRGRRVASTDRPIDRPRFPRNEMCIGSYELSRDFTLLVLTGRKEGGGRRYTQQRDLCVITLVYLNRNRRKLGE